jgi:1-acyl-sn-glycerol-3-phosphate acyltransferase
MSIISGMKSALVDLAGAMLPMSIRDLEGELRDRIAKAPIPLNEYGYDPYGFNPDVAARGLVPAALMYRHYFRSEVHDIEHVPSGRVLLTANHAGQMPYDGMMLTMAMLLDAQQPRICRPMGEYFISQIPFFNVLASRGGVTAGTAENCVQMLEDGSCVMVFPEGARGINKPYSKAYQLQRFGLGFMRLALETQTPIVPVAFVGSEEQQPGLANFQGAADALGLPSLPITATFPLLGPLGLLVALPVKYHIYFGEPLEFEGHPNDEDAVMQERVDVVRDAIHAMFRRGLAERRGIFR